MSAPESSCKINSHFFTCQHFQALAELRDCFCAFSSLAVLGKPSLCLWEVHPKQTCQWDSDRSSPWPLPGPHWCILTLPAVKHFRELLPVLTIISNSSLMNPLVQPGWAISWFVRSLMSQVSAHTDMELFSLERFWLDFISKRHHLEMCHFLHKVY